MLKSLKVVSALLDYPTAELFDCRDELIEVLHSEARQSRIDVDALSAFIDTLFAQPLFDAQEAYTGLFDRGRRHSLLLFEHVHGESRDRGQAMVDLMAAYEEKGFYLDAKELPDYLPLFLEFLSRLEYREAIKWLRDISHILAAIAGRLLERPSPYAECFIALLNIADAKEDLQKIREQVKQEARDDTAEAMDKIWEEEAVTFIGNKEFGNKEFGDNKPNACGSPTMSSVINNSQETPVQWVDADNNNRRTLAGS